MDSIGIINTNYIVEYDENRENHENLDNKFIIKVQSSSLDDVIILFREPNFEKLFREASNCFIVCVELDNNEEEEVDDEYTAMRLEGIFKADPDIILKLNQSLWIKKYFHKKFFNMRSPKIRKYQKLLDDLNFDGNILNAKLKLSSAIDYIQPDTEDFVIKIIKLFKFDNQKEVDEKLFEVAIEQKCSFEVIQSMITFHKESSNGMSKHEVDALFLAKGISVFDEEIIKNFKQELKKEDKEKITDEIEKFHGNEKSLLQHLFSISRIALNSEDTAKEKLKKIETYYSQLIDLNVDSVTDLLRIVDHKLLIIFDFDSNSIERSYLMGSRHNRGIFDQDRMRIFIGAKNSFNPSSQEYKIREWEVIGILIHEICHYVCYKVFDNNCKPYYKDDHNRQEYDEIINEYKSWTDHHEIVGRVFSDYEETMWHAELIVRAVQMIVTYKVLDPKNLEKLEEKYQNLFTYFKVTVMSQIKEYLKPENQLRRQTNDVSSFKLDQFKIKIEMKQLIYDDKKFIHFVETNSQKLAMANFCSNLHDDYAIFTSFKDLIDEFKGKEILSLWGKYSKINIVIYCDQIDIKCESFKGCLDKLNNPDRTNLIFLIFKEHSQNIEILRNMLTNRVENLEKLNFSFSDLTEESKKIILQKTAIFQGSQRTLNKIITQDSKSAQFLPINHFLESPEPIVIGKLPEKNADYDDKMFIERKLSNKNNEQVVEFSTEKMDEILNLLSTRQYIIISDDVGKGKSTLMTYLAYQFLQSTLLHIDRKIFVVKINLHQHVKILENFKDKTPLNRFIFDNFVRNSKFKQLEWAIFEEYYQKGRLILMLDGFDEISPTCEKQTLSIIQKALNSNFSNIIVATRPHILNTLGSPVDSSKIVILNLTPILTSDQINFLTNHFKTQNKVAKKFSETEFDKLIENIMQKLFTSVHENYEDYVQGKILLSSPLHLKMFAEVIRKQIFENKNSFMDVLNRIVSLNMYQIYDELFYIKSDIAEEEKGDVVKKEIKNMQRRGSNRLNFYSCARKLAWNTLHPVCKEEIDEREKTFLQYYGLVTIQNDEAFFIHRSYAEFFIAHLFIEELNKKNFSSTSNFANENFLVNILTVNDHETIKGFIDTALSDKVSYEKISNDSFKCLGKFIINEFKKLEGNKKNFLHCVMFHELKERIRRRPRKDFVFVSHLMIQSLIYCTDEEDVDAIKDILNLPWDINNIPPQLTINDYGYIHTTETGKNLFHLTCDLGINSLILAVWELAEKVFKKDAKEYFLTKSSTSPDDCDFDAVAYAFRRIERNEGKFNIQNCSTIDELRNRAKIRLDHMTVLNTIMSLFEETFDPKKWKLFFFTTDKNGETIIHDLMLHDFAFGNAKLPSAIKLIDIAKKHLGEDFEKLMKLEDINGNSIASLKDQKCPKEENNEEK